MIDLVIITSVSEIDKSIAVSVLKEDNYFVQENPQISSIERFLNDIIKGGKHYQKIAFSIEVENAKQIYEIAKNHKEFSIIFVGITSNEQTLIEQYNLLQKPHLEDHLNRNKVNKVKKDLSKITQLKPFFTHYLDSSNLNINEVRNYFKNVIDGDKNFFVHFSSFGYKFKVPQDINTVFDVRLLANPFWVDELREKNGLDKEIIDYVLNAPLTKAYLKHLIDYLDFYFEELKNNGRRQVSIAIACTGGQHRSVVISEYLSNHYSNKYKILVTHRNLPGKSNNAS